jgi:hypothetical protein
MTNPWTALDAATADKKLYLDPTVSADVAKAFNGYQQTLNTLITDRVDNTSGYFGTDGNPLAKLLEKAFNARGTELVDYLNAQLSQAGDFVKTAKDAATAQANRENS